jgi:carbon storage regulator CsrA
MLVLSRKIGEKIHVGGNITIEVRRVAGNRVTLAVDAPREVRILRGELKDAALAFEDPEPAKPTATPMAPVLPTSAETVVVSHQRLTGLHSMPHALG